MLNSYKKTADNPDSVTEELIRSGRAGDKRAVAKLITAVEAGGDRARSTLARLWPYTGRARILGVTGPPGAGKSTLTDRLAKLFRSRGVRVGIVAVDPTSPFSGGAVLGDRVRMGDLTPDSGVFIRSMGTRGLLGGLSPACAGAADALDACGFDIIIIETAGVGQSEIEVASAADVVTVVTVPGLGDDVQAIKAGIFEIGDIFVVNKSDRPGADRAAADLKAMTETDGNAEKRSIPVLLTSAAGNAGINELYGAVEERFEVFAADGTLTARREERLRRVVLSRVRDGLDRRVIAPAMTDPRFNDRVGEFLARRENPYEWAEELTDSLYSEKMKGNRT